MTIEKNLFIEMLERQASEKMQASDRRRRLDGRLELETLELLGDLLPSVVNYATTSNGNIRADWFKLNSHFKNLHIFNNNTTYINTDASTLKNKYIVIVVIKATYKGVLRIKTQDIIGVRLTLTELLEMVHNGIAKPYSRVAEALGL